MQYRNAARAALLAAISLAAAGATVASAAPISVVVNGSPVSFSGTPPVEQQGSVLVPLRGVFEAMGASVDYNAATRTINATKGSSYVVLPLGSTVATVNGVTRNLSQPAAAVNGTTLVPLRFVAEALGGYVEWHAASSTVDIRTGDPHLATLPAPAGRTVSGQLTGIYTDTVPEQITVRVNGDNTAIPITSSTIVLRSEPGNPTVEVPLSQLSIGDQVTVQRDTDGTATSIASTFGELRGTLKSVGRMPDGTRVITLNDGTTVELAPDADVTMNGRKVALSDILPDESLRIRTNASNSLASHIYVNPGNGPARPPRGGNAPSVTAFRVDARGPLRSGEKLVATLTGTPGAVASFSIPGVVDSVPMTEVSPGVYRGAYTVKPDISVQGASVLGQLQKDGITAPLIQASENLNIASAQPKINSVTPATGATVQTDRPLIYGTIMDTGGTGIDTGRSAILLDGRDVTGDATITPQFFNLRPQDPLAAGRHTVRVTIVDQAGNATRRDWAFNVSNDKVVRSFTTDINGDQALDAGSRINFTLKAQPGGKASVDFPGVATNIPLREEADGVYTGSYTIAQGQNATNVPPTVRFVSPNGSVVTQTLSRNLRVAAGPPIAPMIISPAEGANVGRSITIRGKAQPGSTVQIKVDYTTRGLGGLLSLNGSSGTQQVTADGSGNWEVADLPLRTDSLLAGAGDTQYLITATSINAAGDESPATALDVKGGRVYAHRAGQ